MKEKRHRQVLYGCLRVSAGLVRLLPLSAARSLGSAAGRASWAALGKQRALTLEHLEMAFPERPPAERRRIGEAVFVNLGRVLAELLWFPRLERERIRSLVCAEGMERLGRVSREGKGGIFVCPHMGNWELTGAFCVAEGYPLNVIARQIRHEPYDRWLVALRASQGVRTLYRHLRETFRDSLGLLARNEFLAVLPDQDIDSLDGVYVDFFGKAARVPTGPVSLSMASGAPLIPVVNFWDGRRYQVVVEEPIYPLSTGDRMADAERISREYHKIFERHIREHPDQWVWMHRRWKTSPGSTAEVRSGPTDAGLPGGDPAGKTEAGRATRGKCL